MNNYKQCSFTVMDNISDPYITFDNDGICNYVKEYDTLASRFPPPEDKKTAFDKIINKIKFDGKNSQYDCLIGLSGGVDSSYIAHICGNLNLKALVVHFDNGWNSEMAVNNIKKLIDKYNFDLHTLVVDWEEFKDIQLSFFKASVPNIEIVTDHAIIATLYKIAIQYKIKYIFSGSNYVTEGILPTAWGYDASDYYHIKKVHKIFGSKKIKTFPKMPLLKYFDNLIIKGIKKIPILNYLDYNKSDAIKELNKKVGWKYYGGKHYESVFTQFFQAHVLPHKFKIDKRKAHLSTLICSGQISKDEALMELEKPLYDKSLLDEHTQYFLKKFEISKNEYNTIMEQKPLQHLHYPSNNYLIQKALKFKKLFIK